MIKIDREFTSYLGEPSIGAWEDREYWAIAFDAITCIHLAIYRKDLKDGIPWDELQRIKNACGFEDKDAVEAYPRQKDVINTGNIRHLYVFDEPIEFITRHGNRPH